MSWRSPSLQQETHRPTFGGMNPAPLRLQVVQEIFQQQKSERCEGNDCLRPITQATCKAAYLYYQLSLRCKEVRCVKLSAESLHLFPSDFCAGSPGSTLARLRPKPTVSPCTASRMGGDHACPSRWLRGLRGNTHTHTKEPPQNNVQLPLHPA